VYRPVGEIVPVAAVPPAIPLTAQITAGFALPAMAGANCCDPPAATFADGGEMENVLWGGEGCGGVFPPLPHPTIRPTNDSTELSFHLLMGGVPGFFHHVCGDTQVFCDWLYVFCTPGSHEHIHSSPN